ncbi:MAG: cytochrome c family protein [Maricaulis sp.]|jgi:cytochrome c|nr:cytochrome c family protein [Maricaulis sp.]
MGDLFWNKVAGVLIAGILIVLVIKELGHTLVPTHAAHDLDEHNTAYPVDWAAIGGDAAESGPAIMPAVDYGVLLAAADVSRGESAIRQCSSCHTFVDGAGHSTGPNLWGVVDRGIGSADGYSYSAALSGIAGGWDYAALNDFLTSPRAYAPGTAMSFAGIRSESTRMNVIAYLRSLSANPAPLPAPLADMVEDVAADVMQDTPVETLAETLADTPAETSMEAPAEAPTEAPTGDDDQ